MAEKHFRVVNLEKYQHYKDRNPTWIKLYRTVLSDFEHITMPDASKWHLSAIYLLASAHDNKLPFNDEIISRLIQANTKTNLNLLLSHGFISMLAEPAQDGTDLYGPAIPETETETETYTEETYTKERDVLISEKAERLIFEIFGGTVGSCHTELVKTFGDGWFCEAMLKAQENGICNIKYVTGILQNYQRNGGSDNDKALSGNSGKANGKVAYRGRATEDDLSDFDKFN